MNEHAPKVEVAGNVSEDEYFDAVNKLLFHAERLVNSAETLTFPGLKPDSYAKLKQESIEFPDYATDIDALCVRFSEAGMRVIIAGSDVFVLPHDSSDIEKDGLMMRHLLDEAVLKNVDLRTAILQSEICCRYHKLTSSN